MFSLTLMFAVILMIKLKNKKKGKQYNADAVSASTADDFDDMLPGLWLAYLTAFPNGSSASTASKAPPAPIVSDSTLIEALHHGDFTSIRQWGRQRFCPNSAAPFLAIIVRGKVDVMRCMVEELGADINGPPDGNPKCAPLFLALNRGRLDMV